jgi:hypothetical protein
VITAIQDLQLWRRDIRGCDLRGRDMRRRDIGQLDLQIDDNHGLMHFAAMPLPNPAAILWFWFHSIRNT